MKLTRCRKLGRFINPETGKPVNVHKGYEVQGGWTRYYYLFRGERVLIAFNRQSWKETDER